MLSLLRERPHVLQSEPDTQRLSDLVENGVRGHLRGEGRGEGKGGGVDGRSEALGRQNCS